jgi:preprotein translocase subunit SecA
MELMRFVCIPLQAVEAKEGVAIKEDNHPTASITFQIFFRYPGGVW